eukprot:scaffold238751_cov22-Tisochrysis_lutea.AAC.1
MPTPLLFSILFALPAGYRQWGEAFMRQFMNIRFSCCCLGAVIAPFKAMLARDLWQTMLLLLNAVPYVYYFHKPQVRHVVGDTCVIRCY